jgi:gliding motility-associated-like protein
MRSVLFILLIFSSFNLKAQEFYPLDYFPVWDMPTTQFNGVGQDLIGPNLYEPFNSVEIFNIHLEYTFFVKRITGNASTPFGSTFSGAVMMPLWFKVQDINGATCKFLKPDVIIDPQTPSILPECGVVDASWVAHDYVGQTSLNTAIITQSDFMVMFANSEIGDVIESQISIDIQTPINVVDSAAGIFMFNDYYGNWSDELNAGNWFAVKDLNGNIFPTDSFNGFEIGVEYADISISLVENESHQLDLLSLQQLNDTIICESQLLEVDFPPGNFEEFDTFQWYYNDDLFSDDSTLLANQAGLYTLTLFGCDTISKTFSLSYYDVDLTLYDQNVCPGDTAVINFPSGDFSMYNDFIWHFEGQYFSNDSNISIFEDGLYEIEFYGCDTLSEEFELTYFQSNVGDDLMSDISICEGETVDVEFPADIVNLGYTNYNWVFDNDSILGSNGSLSISTEGLYTLNLYGCDTISDDFNLNVNQPNNTDYQFNDTLICEGDQVSINFPDGDFSSYPSFVWALNGESFSTDSTLVLEEEGVYSLSFYGCPFKIDSFEVNYKSGYINPLDDITQCVQNIDTVHFPSGNHDQYDSFSWFLNGGYFDSDSSINVILEGIYEIQLYGCDTISQNFTYSHYDPSPPDLSFSDTTICEWDYLSLEFSLANYESYFDFAWSGPDGFYSTDSITEFSTAGTYYLEVYGCDSLSDTFNLTVIPNDTLDISFNDSLICEGDTILVQFPDGDFSNYTDFTWYINDEIFEMESDSSIVITNPGEYSLHLNGCPYLSDNFFINFYEYPLLMSDSELNVDSVIYICLEEDPVLVTPFDDFPHTWYLDGLSFDTDIYNERTLILEEILDQINLNQVYTYDVEIDFECGVVASNNTVDVSVIECECGLDMPNVFTPDGNDNNDYFKPYNNYEGEFVDPESLCMSTDFNMEIFNQWGKHIISIDSDDELPYWDGLNANGREMNAGVYFYRITYQVNIYSLPETKEITGYFHLFK